MILIFDIIKGCDRELRLDVKFGGMELKVIVIDVELENVWVVFI